VYSGSDNVQMSSACGIHKVATIKVHSFFLLSLPCSNGELDPWSGGGVTRDITDTLVAINIHDGAHHLDLRAHNAFDPSSVLLSRLLEVKHMKKWILDFYSNIQ
jgi:hypothetical protein